MSGTSPRAPADMVVLGAGAWGTALAIMLARAGNAVTLVTRGEEKCNTIKHEGQNSHALPGIPFPPNLETQYEARRTVAQNPDAVIVLAMPAQQTRAAVHDLAGVLGPGHRLVVTAKGLERGSNALLTSVIEEEAPGQPTAILSGPSFAHDVGAGLPTAVTLAAATLDDAKDLANGLKSNSFRPYASDDLVGVQLGGALKNVLAIAAGAVDGKGLGESAKAALITRGFTELGRLATALGARRETLSGLSGLGDLVLTCSTAGSRNYRFGLDLGRGVPVPKLLGAGQPLAEGAKTAAAALALGRTHGVELPITSVVAQIVAGELSVDEAIEALMARPLRHE